MNKSNVKKIAGFSIIALSLLMLSGCGGTFRNRAFDYTRTDVNQVPPLQIPNGVTKPSFQPALSVPPGPSNYPPSTMPAMTPPNYNDTYQIDKKTKQATQLTGVNASSAQSAPAQPLVASTKVKPVQAALPAMKLSSQVLSTTGNIPMLQINAPFDTAWNQMAAAIQKSGYRIVNSDQSKGYYFIALQGNSSPGTILLYLKPNQSLTQAILYNSAGNPDASNNAKLTLQQFSKNL